ncbi:MAG: septum formation inhibitor Maf [Piscirickettsiaceae bacterium]|nr:MAG: septum formation inhibitor Maf [Piscirickettsiaceae bacterium]
MKNQRKLILASSSPYRKSLLQKICPNFESASPDINETNRADEKPITLSKRLAFEKTHALTKQYSNHLIIGSDQVAMLDDTQLHKPGSHKNAVAQLKRSSGKTIHFYTSVCVLDSSTEQHAVDTDHCIVQMRPLTIAEIERYVTLDQPYGCAAAFKSEGLGIALFETIDGNDPNALVGLPLIKLTNLLKQFDYNVL